MLKGYALSPPSPPITIRGVWQPQTVALFDVRVTDTDAPSHSQRVVTAVLSSAEKMKQPFFSINNY